MSDRGYTITRRLEALPDVVWEAWTQPEHFARWFGTEAVEMRDVAFDLRPGGAWRGTMVLPDGTLKHWHGTFVEVDAPRRLVMTISDEQEVSEGFERFTLTLAGREGHTEMVLRQSGGHLTDEQYEQARVGTESFMDSLAALLPGILKARHDAL
jgi:uncharacterized protein YndB with AHSA1/START domain